MLKTARKISCVLAAVIAFGSLSFYKQSAKAAGVWDCTILPEGSSYANTEEDSLDLYFKTDGNEGKANAERNYDLSENEQICISFTSEFSSEDSGAVRRLNLQNNSLTSTEILNMTGTSLKVFGTSVEQSLEAGEKYRFDIGIKPDTGYASIWLDSEQIYSGAIGSKWKNFNYSSMNVLFRNTSSSKKSTLESRWEIGEYSLTDTSEDFTVSPKNGEEFVDSERGGIDIKFSGLKAPSVFEKDNFELTADSEPITVTTERNGNSVRLVLSNGLEPGKHYALTIKSICDTFGTIQKENEVIEFDTADSDYEKASVSISSDKTSIYDTESAYITVNARSSLGIAKTVIYVNDKEYTSFDGTAEGFEFSGESGKYKIYAEVTDAMGGKAVSETVVIEILHNDAPIITISGIANGTTYDSAKLKNIKISSTDNDGSVESLIMELDGEITELKTDDDNELDLSGLAPAIHKMKITATDNFGTSTEKEVTFTVIAGYTTTPVFSSDFNSYVSDGTTSPGLSFTLNGDAQLISSQDYGEEHGTVVLFKTDGEEVNGTSAQGSWGRIVTSNTTDGFIISLDINLLNDKGYFYYMVKHPTMSPLAMDVQIKGSELTLNNNGSVAVRVQLEPGKWYNTKYKVDLKSHTYSYWLDGELIADDFNFGNPAITQADTRLVMEFIDKIPTECGLVFDNLSVEYIKPIPQITAISYDNEEITSKISPYAEKLNLTLNTALAANTINKESVRLYCGDERVYYDSLVYDSDARKIEITLSEQLRSAEKYSIELTDKVTTSDGGEISGGISGEFDVDYMDVDTAKLEIKKNGGTVHAEGSIYNRTGTPGSCYVIVNVFNGKRLVNTRVQKISYGRGMFTDFSTGSADMTGGTRAEVYIWNSLLKPKPLSSKIYTAD